MYFLNDVFIVYHSLALIMMFINIAVDFEHTTSTSDELDNLFSSCRLNHKPFHGNKTIRKIAEILTYYL
jgi:hypothetical protein